jgi:hypothetical protein
VKVIFLFIFLFASGFLHAQNVSITRDKHKYDSLYYDKLSDQFTLKLLSFTKYSDFNLSDITLNKKLEYNAHPGPSLGLGFHYKWLGLAVSTGFNPQRDSIYEKSRQFDFQTHLFLRRLTLQFYSSVYSGYYLNKPDKFISDWPAFKPYSRSDIRTQNFGFSGSYIFNSGRFSNRANNIQSEWQKKSAGSLVVGLSALYNRVKADSAIIPEDLVYPDFFRDTNFIQSKQLTFGGQVGYTFTVVLRQHFFVNFSFMGGFSAGRNMFQLDKGGTISKTQLSFITINSAGLGYNSKRFYAGFNYSNLVSTTPTPVKNTSIDYSIGKFQLVLAYRFKIREHESILPKCLPFKL